MDKRDAKALRNARWKRERRAERNIRNEYRQGRGPEGLDLTKDGRWMACCNRCEMAYEWEAMAVEYSEASNYCGRSEWCIP